MQRNLSTNRVKFTDGIAPNLLDFGKFLLFLKDWCNLDGLLQLIARVTWMHDDKRNPHEPGLQEDLKSFDRERLDQTFLATPALFRTASNLFRRWQLDAVDACRLIGNMEPAQWHACEAQGCHDLTDDQVNRIRSLIDIHEHLGNLYSNPEIVYQWVRDERKEFQGVSALQFMLDGGQEAISEVRRSLRTRRVM